MIIKIKYYLKLSGWLAGTWLVGGYIFVSVFVYRKDFNRFIKVGRYKFFFSGRVVYIKYCRYVIYVYYNRSV